MRKSFPKMIALSALVPGQTFDIGEDESYVGEKAGGGKNVYINPSNAEAI